MPFDSLLMVGRFGDQIQQWVIYPPGYDPGKKYPLVQLLHGGPHTMVRDAFSYRGNAHVFVAAGYFVTWVNRHGSTGFGEEFALSIQGQWGEKPFTDVMLLIHGEQDYRVPYGNGIELDGVLQSMGVPSRLVLFPNENHWVLSPQNSIYWNYEVQQWLGRHIGGSPMPKPEFGNGEEKESD